MKMIMKSNEKFTNKVKSDSASGFPLTYGFCYMISRSNLIYKDESISYKLSKNFPEKNHGISVPWKKWTTDL